MVSSHLFVEPNQHVAVVGPTGSGKTFLVTDLLTFYDNVVILDPKRKWDWTNDNHYPERKHDKRYQLFCDNQKDLQKLMRRVAKDDSGYPIVYQPPKQELLRENSLLLDSVAERILERGNTIYVVDETAYIANATDFQERAPNFYLCLATGRGLGVGVWCLMQRPRRVPTSALSETEKRFVFYLPRESDRKAVDQDLVANVPWETLRKHDHSFVIGTDRFTSKAQLYTPEK